MKKRTITDLTRYGKEVHVYVEPRDIHTFLEAARYEGFHILSHNPPEEYCYFILKRNNPFINTISETWGGVMKFQHTGDAVIDFHSWATGAKTYKKSSTFHVGPNFEQ